MKQMEEQLSQTGSALKNLEGRVKSLSDRIGQLEGHLNQIRCDLKQREDEVISSIWRMSTMEYSHQQHQHTRMKQMEGQLRQTRSDFKLKEDYVVSLIQRMEEMKGQLRQIRYDLKQKRGEVESLIQRSEPKYGERMESLSHSGTEMEHSHQQHHQDLRMKQMEGHLDYMRSALEHKEKEVESLSHSMRQMEEQLSQTRSALKLKEKEVESPSLSMEEMKGHLNQTRSALKLKEKEVASPSLRVTEMERSYQQQNQDLRMKQMEGQLRQTRSALEHKVKEVESLSHSMEEMKGHLIQTRSALKEKDKELKSFKDRVAADVTLSMKTGKTFESMNSPVSRSRLKEMYEELWMEWPKIKKYLRSNQENPESVKEQIQKEFKEAMLDMEKKKQQIDEMFGLDEASRGSESVKVQQYRESTCQNLQLALYHRKKEDADLKTPSSGHEGGKLQDVKESSSGHESGKPQDVKEYWSSKCYWLGCLMALNNPPLHPDWENHPQSMDKWDLLPRNFTAASGK